MEVPFDGFATSLCTPRASVMSFGFPAIPPTNLFFQEASVRIVFWITLRRCRTMAFLQIGVTLG
jgi:hypothetical protein